MLVADSKQIAAKLGAFARIETGGRFVETKQHRVRAHCASDLEAALGPIGEFAGRIVGTVAQPNPLQPVARLLDGRALRACVRAKPQRPEHGISGGPHQRIVLRDQKVFQDRHALEQPDILERASDAGALRDQIVGHPLEQKQNAVAAADAACAPLGQGAQLIPHAGVAELQSDASLARLVKAGDAVEDSGLAGAVWPDQGGNSAAVGGEGEIINGDEAAEAHAEMLDAQHGRKIRGRRGRARMRAGHARGAAHPWRSCASEGFVVFCSRKSARRDVFSSVEGSRVAISPRGLHTMISTIAKPNSSMRYWAGSKALPNTTLRKSSSRMISVPPIMITAAIATPSRLPIPPSKTMATITADSMKVKLSGEMNPCRAATNDPAKPANMAPIANAVSLVLVVLMPSERQAISSSRKASHARPIGSRRSRTVRAAVTNASARMR